MAEEIAAGAAAAVAAPTGGSPDTGAAAVEAEPQSIQFDFGDGEPVEAKFEETSAAEDKFPEWDKTLEEKYKEQPEILKQLKDGHFREKSWRDTGFRSAKEVRQYQESVNELAESLGRSDGLKGLDAIKAETQEWATVYAGLASGDLGVAEEFFSENPEAIDNLTPAMLNLWYKQNPENYSSSIARIMLASLNQPDESGMTFAAQLNQLESLLGDNEQAKKAIQAIRERIGSYAQLAAKQPERKAPDVDKRVRDLEARERELGLNRLQMSAVPVVRTAVSQAVKGLLKGKNIPADRMGEIEREVAKEFQSLQLSDKEYQRNLQDVLSSGDESRVTRLLKAKIVRSMPQAAKKVIGRYLSFQGKPEPKSEAGAGGTSSEPTRLKWTGAKDPLGRGPAIDEIDLARMREEFGSNGTKEMLSKGQFYAKRDKSKNIYVWE
jgi:hypothetical protein